MLIKVCGMRDAENIAEVARLQPDLMGFIFFERSPRSALGIDPTLVRSLPKAIGRVGVLVNETIARIEHTAATYGLTHIQLHGDEPPEFCLEAARATGCKIIKATTPDRGALYDDAADYLLFDTPSPQRGGTGERFDWRTTAHYTGPTPWLLSGGIGADHAEEIIAKHPFGIDINSRFEIEVGLKNTELLKHFIHEIRKHEQDQ